MKDEFNQLVVQINDFDSYQATPTKLDNLYSHVSQVPIIRIYGSLSLSDQSSRKQVHNVLIHVHNAFPYFYIDCYEKKPLKAHIDTVTAYLESNLISKNRDNTFREHQGGIRRYIATVSVCKAVPIYGYQVGDRHFYKIAFTSSNYKSQLVKMIYNNQIKIGQNTHFQIYEAHLPFLSQFLFDFNLFGCGWLNIKNTSGLYFRNPICNKVLNNDNLITFLSNYITHDNLVCYPRIGKSLLEIDINTNIISNRDLLKPRYIHSGFHEYNDFIKSTQIGHQIYLNSLNHIYQDLKFQCNLRNSDFNQITQESNYFGMGKTTWSNQQELDDLLSYFIKLNKSTNLNINVYAKKYLNHCMEEIPTSFELIDIEKKSLFHNFKLVYNSDLIKWKDYEALFKHNSFDEMIPNTVLMNQGSNEILKSSFDGVTDLILDIQFSEFSEVEEKAENNQNNDNAILEQPGNVDDDEIEEFSSEYFSENDKEENIEDEIIKDEDIYEEQNLNVKEKVDESYLVVERSPNYDEEISDFSHFQETQVQAFDSKIVEEISQNQVHSFNKSATQNLLQIPLSFTDDSDFSRGSLLFVLKYLSGGNNCTYEIKFPDNLQKCNIVSDLEESGLLKIEYQVPFYEKSSDVPNKPFIFANQKIVLPLVNNEQIKNLQMSALISKGIQDINFKVENCNKTQRWRYTVDPPLKIDIVHFINHEESRARLKMMKFTSQIEPGITQGQSYKCSYNSNKLTRKDDGYNHLTNFHLELHCNTTAKNVNPNPATDPITAIFYNFDDANSMFFNQTNTSGVLMLASKLYNPDILEKLKIFLPNKVTIEYFDTENLMIDRLIDLVDRFDPDILSGYEVIANSWGYIVDRFRSVYDINLLHSLSRGYFKSDGKLGDHWGYTHTTNIKLNGRHIINVWRILRSDLTLTNYSLENISFHLLHQSLPRYLNYDLSNWINSNNFLKMLLVLKYYIRRLNLVLKIIEVQELITKNVEFSRVIGIDFNSNFYRGSQFKVESILGRLAKLENMLLNSPSKMDVHNMRSLECISLTMEPDSNFYRSPLVVLDFQSLYPSLIIAYNYCFSTIIGRLRNYKPNKNVNGFLKHLKLPPGIVDLLKRHDGINVSPNGCIFVKSSIRKSVLAKMLEELLTVRQAVKRVMSLFEDEKELKKLYNARQLALKLIANVTYGYASATFSGRMPNSDLADAIVSTGREILVKSISMIESGNYGAKVVYGDTDSLFVYFPGKSRADAFKLGREIAKTISNNFPDPIILKFEKVYHPSVLLAKKRYVGYSYEDEDQVKPKFDAKGIETIRRDGVPAQAKILEKTLRILFDTANVSKVKEYTLNQFHKILLNKISVNDFCFAKEVRYGTYKSEKHLPPGAIISAKKVANDHRLEPQYKERVPYVVVYDPKRARIKDRVMSPEDFINTYKTDDPMILDYEYYITRVLIPPIARIFNLIGADVKGWYLDLPKFSQLRLNAYSNFNENYITSYIKTTSCMNCGRKLIENVSRLNFLCNYCLKNELELISTITQSTKLMEFKVISVEKICEDCVSHNFSELGINANTIFTNSCSNRTCTVYYNKFKIRNENAKVQERNGLILQELEW